MYNHLKAALFRSLRLMITKAYVEFQLDAIRSAMSERKWNRQSDRQGIDHELVMTYDRWRHLCNMMQ